MPLPDSWTDELLRRLRMRYGIAFLRQYELAGVTVEEVRDDWARVLHGLSADAISYGLETLDPDKAPNALQFRALCKAKPDTSMPALPAPNPAGLRRLAQELAPLRNVGGITFEELLAHHRGRRDRGEPMSPAQRAWLAAAEEKASGTGGGQVMEQFNPPPEESLPPGMRKTTTPQPETTE
jgi:hypothetical protein